jgi:excisionase family DNA binding protein
MNADYLTTDELAAQWRMKPRAVRDEIKRKRLRAAMIGGRWLVTPADAESYVRSRMNIAPIRKRTREPRKRAS